MSREKKKHKLGTMTTTPKHLYPFIQHSVNVYCEPDITSGCVPAVPDVTVIHTRMFLECCFSALVISGVPLISRKEPLGQNEVQVLTNVAHTWPSTTCPCSSSTVHLPFYAPVAHLWFLPPPPLASTCLDPPCQITQRRPLPSISGSLSLKALLIYTSFIDAYCFTYHVELVILCMYLSQ